MTETNSITERVMHTPGPWLAEPVPADARVDPDLKDGSEDDAFWILGQSIDEVIAAVYRYPVGQAEGNARLIATAPKLVAALSVSDIDQIVEAIENFVMGPTDDPALDAIWQPYIDKLHALRSAIVEAGGE